MSMRTIPCPRCARKFATEAALARHAADTHDNPVLAEMVAELRDALMGLVGLVELVLPTLSGSQHAAVRDNHRLVEARAVLAKTGAALAEVADA